MLTKNDLQQIQEVVNSEIKPVKKDIKTLKSDVSEIRKDVKAIISYFDRDYVNLRKRIERIEEHLGFANP